MNIGEYSLYHVSGPYHACFSPLLKALKYASRGLYKKFSEFHSNLLILLRLKITTTEPD